MCSDKTIKSGAILSFDAVCAGSLVIIMSQPSKQTGTRIQVQLGIIYLIQNSQAVKKDPSGTKFT